MLEPVLPLAIVFAFLLVDYSSDTVLEVFPEASVVLVSVCVQISALPIPFAVSIGALVLISVGVLCLANSSEVPGGVAGFASFGSELEGLSALLFCHQLCF